MTDEMNWRKDIRIDPTNILKSMWEQTDIFAKYAGPLADATSRKQSLQRKLKNKEAEVELNYRNNPEDFGITDTREGGIKAAVQLNEEVMTIGDELEEVQKEVNTWTQAVLGCDHRRTMLKLITELVTRHIFSIPDVIEEHKLQKQKVVLQEADHLKQLAEGRMKKNG